MPDETPKRVTALLVRDSLPDTPVVVLRKSDLLPRFVLVEDKKGEVFHVHIHSLKEIVTHETAK